MTSGFFDEIIAFVKESKPSKHALSLKKMELCKRHKVKSNPTDIEVLLHASRKDLPFLKKYLLTKPTRTISGVAVVAVMTRPAPCPHGRCSMCPGGVDSVFGSVPQSYTGKEPATLRAIRNRYDPYLQVFNRLEQYVVLGQDPSKVELIIMGGTFPSLPKGYKESFVRDCFKAMNDFSRLFFSKGSLDISRFRSFFGLPGEVGSASRVKSIHKKLLSLKTAGKTTLEKVQLRNEKAAVKCVGLTIETRPDFARLKHARELLRLGCTRVELGVQSVYDEALERISRGHSVYDSITAIRTLKDLGFKLNFHMMLGLPGVDPKKELEGLEELFNNSNFKPDMLKLYPCMVLKGTRLFDEWKKGRFKPITTSQAARLIRDFKKTVPEYVRIMRVQRDIPTSQTAAGVDRTNLRQMIDEEMKRHGEKCRCIRCREIRGEAIREPVRQKIIMYNASFGKEYFISFEDASERLLGFCRLRIPSQPLVKEITGSSAIVRELHVYGSAVAVGTSGGGKAQHRGFGRRLMMMAERIAMDEGKVKVVVISGVGVRDYYRRLGYKKEGTYMVKSV
ncbi:tRNA uridine(34) 5-carboxymethylaminomethyl modification radical SAM/GNAT enzyme Elp3 [Candidatus Woesearchaeota archaeon]|nr:tRNA uridine(34) 5-carboxymethylaminomethyl modification radical SAM/GNAT enzyme Elp3 [Candidatus Woesearchaeota archaeon]